LKGSEGEKGEKENKKKFMFFWLPDSGGKGKR